ncbi:adenylosuccinate lyase, partial [Candidatus Woesearchaeota archaeon]|nr:adenylosuccinate lyase [Candidatus Woesearchaeota archaeon]
MHPERKKTEPGTTIGLFENISPLDFRYYGRDERLLQEVAPYLSEEGFVRYLAKVESALTRTLADRGICSQAIADEVERAANQVTAREVYAEEDRIKHNIRALANCIRNKVSEEAKPFVHYTATSHDIICTADAARYNDFVIEVLWNHMLAFEKTLIELAEREKHTVQIGRTHGQHAEPITFGFAVAQYVSRFGNAMEQIHKTANNLRGKMAGAVGAYNASSLSFTDPTAFEKEVLGRLGIKPSPISTQVVAAEYMSDFVHSILSAFSVLANLADDMRHLQRSEIGEVGEFFEAQQVGSSTMPQKRNPINFENVKSMWKVFAPRMLTSYMDQVSEHQRDLTNSASSRFTPEILVGFLASLIRINRVMKKLVVDKNNLKKNFDQNKDMITAEPLYILLASHNLPDAHEYVREKTLDSQRTGKPLR